LFLIDHRKDLPPVIAGMTTPFEPALPDDEEIEAIIKQTLRKVNEESRIDVRLNRKELQTVVRNLQGLSRRQARQVILDTVCCDRVFDASDMNTILAEKRRALAGDGLLDYVEAPVDLNEIGGLARLKSWLCQRRDCTGDEAAAFGITPPRGILML